MAVVIDPAAIEPATRASGGVKGMRLDASDRVLAAITLTPGEGELIIATDTGCGKRVLIADFDPQNRGGKGVRCVTWAKNGASGTRLAGALRVTTPYDVCFIYKDGSVHRFSSEEFRLAGRADKPHVIDLVAGNNPVAAITVGE